MRHGTIAFISFLTIVVGLISALPSMAQNQPIKTSFVHLGPNVPGVLYEPVTPGAKSHIAIFLMHARADYLTHSACTEMAKRGYRVLCANNSASSSAPNLGLNMDKILLDAGLGVAYLRSYPGVRKVVLLGHSGGGALMSAYQDIAENGAKACQGTEEIVKCSDRLAGLPPADGLMLVDSNFGLAAMTLFSIDPAVVKADAGQPLNPELNLFNPANGFNSHGSSSYSEAFIHGFLSEEGKRMDELIKTAQSRLAAISAGKGRYSDDEPFIVPGAGFQGGNNKLFAQDVALMSHTRKAWPLLRPDGSTVTEIVHTVRVPENPRSMTSSLERGALQTTVRNFLSTFAVRVTKDYGYNADFVRGIDWASSYSCPPGTIGGVTVPTLIMGMTGHWEFMAAETIFDHSKSSDKTLVYVEGATHNYTTCTKCEKYHGQFGNTEKTTYDYVDSWLIKKGRFDGTVQP